MRHLLAALLILLLAPAAASAQTLSATPVTDPMVKRFAVMGHTFWEARGVQVCPSPRIFLADMNGADGAAKGCLVWIDTGLLLRAGDEGWFKGRRDGGDSIREQLCTTIFHELGHTAGLGHTETGLMSPHGEVPGVCHQWRLRKDRIARASFRDRRDGVRERTG